MIIILLVITLLSLFAFTIAVTNLLTMRTIKAKIALEQRQFEGSISLLIPMRNEERNVIGLMESVLSSKGLNQFEVCVLNDGSTDKTAELLQGYRDQISLFTGLALPQGWMGKPYACHQLAEKSTGDYLVFIDADVRVEPIAILASINELQRLNWDFISPYPKQIAYSALELMIQPLLQWSWISSVPLRIAEKYGVRSMTVANGQLFIVRRSAYFAVGGHASVKSEVLEDLQLARNLVAAGYKGGVADASQIAQCHMYNNSRELFDGYTKSLWNAFGGPIGAVAALSLLTMTQIAPLLIALSGYPIAWIAFFLSSLTHGMAAVKTRSARVNLALHPISISILIGLTIASYWRKSQGTLTWRDRSVTS